MVEFFVGIKKFIHILVFISVTFSSPCTCTMLELEWPGIL